MSISAKNRLFAAGILVILVTVGITLFMDLFGRPLLAKRGKDAYLASKARSYDRLMTQSTPVVILLFGNLFVVGAVISAYELLAFGASKLGGSRSKHLTKR